MKYWICIATVLGVCATTTIAATTTATAQSTCPDEWFISEFVSLVDILGPPGLLAIPPDPNLSFFRDIMLFNENEIDEAADDALVFFNTKFGLDFSLSPPDGLGQRFFENATFYPFVFPPELEYTITFNRWITTGSTRTFCYPNRDGGFLVVFNGDQLLHGTYGGIDGISISPGSLLVWGFYNIPVCPQQPIVIHYESGTPVRFEPVDGFGVINCDLFHRILGPGIAQGIFTEVPTSDPNTVHYTIRNLFTFPPHPGLL